MPIWRTNFLHCAITDRRGLRFSESGTGFLRLSGLTAVDWYPADPRFEIVYLLHSLKNNARLRLNVRFPKAAEIDSVTGVWRGADWYEREVFDMFGDDASAIIPTCAAS